MAKERQCDRVLDYMRRFGSITQADAYADLGVYRLASRMHDLKEQGVKFEANYETKRNRYGEPVTYVRYTLKEDACA